MNKYQIIHDDLVKAILAGKYHEKMLPSDYALMNRYHVARETARKAIAMLVDEGYAMRIKGKGTFVIQHNRYSFPISHVESYRELANRLHLKEHTQLVAIQDAEVPATFDSKAETVVLATEITRVRYLDDEPIIIDRDYVLKAVIPEILALPKSLSLFELFEQQLGLTISHATKTITIETLSIQDKQLMKLPEAGVVVVVRSETFLSDGRTLSYTESRHRADKFKSVEFARRH
ncbi:MAG: hypothetical protein Q611_LSC00295G0002 [Leuconostoc sp. DORA_2]|jgi:GntR family trehalose operon transcriptional repressor|uniref:trehalose operon repressor n=1 Tax=uncultured Leuconostoc sp. TaxID=173262 RepID=UPI0003D64944|nr:trehalose operon repressor [uncultured Leuconostoc sp.]ETI99391.1 MAG: hypothetical protein Q611_LSC00295G0002 [Leuconostoc sp. DORA_2]